MLMTVVNFSVLSIDCFGYNLVIELVTRTDFERNKLADVVSSFNAVAGICDDVLEFDDKLLIIIG